MLNADMTPLRSWREIAKQASEEHDPDKALELAQELIRALDRESMQRMDKVTVTVQESSAA